MSTRLRSLSGVGYGELGLLCYMLQAAVMFVRVGPEHVFCQRGHSVPRRMWKGCRTLCLTRVDLLKTRLLKLERSVSLLTSCFAASSWLVTVKPSYCHWTVIPLGESKVAEYKNAQRAQTSKCDSYQHQNVIVLVSHAWYTPAWVFGISC